MRDLQSDSKIERRTGATPRVRPPLEARPDEGCLHELFESTVDHYPDRPALVGRNIALTYRELDHRANQLAHLLRAYDAGPGKLVGLYYHRSYEPIVSILACLKAGAGYIPIDPVHPKDRIAHILEEAEVELVLTEQALSESARECFTGRVLPTDLLKDEIAVQPATRLSVDSTGVLPSNLAYVIYTSGTTGRPKGVMAEHGHAYRYALSMNAACTTTPEDRIYQGFSLGFDGSIEEIWMAYANGAALVVPDRQTAKFGDDLAAYLSEHGVTYFSTVPTALATISEDIPSLTQLVVSGEACPPELVDRWAKPGRIMLNVYGPTEATVNTTAKICEPGQPITIGKPLPGYTIHILDSQQRPVPRGEKGELFVGGPTLARGYLNREDLTQEKFVTLPDVASGRLYRTGDLVRWNAEDELEFFGRIDGQVKIRGYRVELSEIEAVLLEHDTIQSAVTRVHDKNGFKVLTGYVVPEEDSVDRNDVLSLLKKRLPDYMVPSYLEELEEFPTLASGKVNRALLPAPETPLVRTDKVIQKAATPTELAVSRVWTKVLAMPDICIDDDFFQDLGGYSLLAAQVVTRLRDEEGLEVAIRDSYRFPTIRKLAAHLDEMAKVEDDTPPAPTAEEVYLSVPKWERNTVKALQALSIFSFYAVGTLPFSILVYVFNSVFFGDMGALFGVSILLVTGLLAWPVAIGTAVASKWILLGTIKPGERPVWSFYYFRWWLASRLQTLSGSAAFAGTPLMPIYYRMMGAKVGRDCVIDTSLVTAWDLISIGDESTISADSQLLGYRVEGGLLKFGRVDVGRRCFVGGHSAFGLDVVMGDDCLLDDQSYLADGTQMPDGESRNGSPAVPAEVHVPEVETPRVAWKRPVFWSCMFLAIAGFSWVLTLTLGLAYLVVFVGAFYFGGLAGGVAWLVVGAPFTLALYCVYLGLLRRLVMPEAETGTYPVESWKYLRRWYMDGLMRANRIVLKPIYTTIYLAPWLRFMGAKIGERAEISTVWYCSPELIELGAESFFADGCIIGGRRTFRGHTQVERVRIGRRSFIGNGAHVPSGYTVGENCLLGVLSSPPCDGQTEMADNTEWLGNPAFNLPNRKRVGGFDVSTMFRPTKKLYAQRLLIDGLRVLFPTYLGTAALVLEVAALVWLYFNVGLLWMVAISPFVTFGLAIGGMLSVIALKWLVMGRIKPVIKPLWCTYVWWNEMVNGAYESVFTPLVSLFLGTPFIAPFLRMIGIRTGKNTYISSILFSEFDLVEIGDYVSLDLGSVLQTHLFEDRVFKSSYCKLEAGCSIGNMSVVLYDTHMRENSSLAPLSLLMKGESLKPASRWHGIPTTQIH